MNLLITIILILIGFVFLVKGADLLIKGASSLATKWNVSQLVIGLTVVSFGTSTPELSVNVFAAISGHTDVSFGNVVGSNIVNILLILGIAALVRPLQSKKNTVWKEIPFTLLAGLTLFIMCNDNIFSDVPNILGTSDGIVLLFFFIIFIVYVFSLATVEGTSNVEIKNLSNLKIIIYIIVGLAGLVLGSELVVEEATSIAKLFNVSDRIIGLTIVAIGTSLPELFTSVVAAYKGDVDIAVGNVVGSNIFNVFFILSVSSIISPIQIDASMNFDMIVMIIASLLLFFTMFTGKKRLIDRWEALVFLIIYLSYNIFLLR